MNILSLFDGISCGQIALNLANIKYDNYFASEIDKHAIKVTQYNYPNTIQLGDINSWKSWTVPQIDLLIGGSPCQNLSSIGNKKYLSGEKSGLFYKFVEIFNTIKPKYFIFENVASMNKESKKIISDLLKIEPILINSNIFVPQNRRRLYWTNILISKFSNYPTSKTVFDILEKNVDSKYFLTEHQKLQSFKISSFNKNPQTDLRHARPLVTTAFSQRAAKDNLYHRKEFYADKTNLRKLTPTEFEILQGIPINYTSILSDNQRYRAVGNAWTIDVISYLLSFIK